MNTNNYNLYFDHKVDNGLVLHGYIAGVGVSQPRSSVGLRWTVFNTNIALQRPT